MTKKRKTLGFALGAGGSRGVAHIGFIKAMEEAGIKADFVAGTSMGSVVGACYSAGYSADFMKQEIDKLKMSDIFDLSFLHHPARTYIRAMIRSSWCQGAL